MDYVEGALMVPPDRNQIIGRALWKVRHVVIGRRSNTFREHQSTSSFSHLKNTNRIVSGSSKPSPLKTTSDEPCISIYKSKDDTEPIQQWSLGCVTDCQVQMVAWRKQGPVLPTLIITMTDKNSKRRSGRAAGLVPSTKEGSAAAVWFRTPPEDTSISLQEWARFIMARKDPWSPEESPATPSSTSTFSPRPRENSDYFPRPGSGKSNARVPNNKSSMNTFSSGTRERPQTFSSESPSLRSKRSDISSPSSNYPVHQTAYAIPGQHYTTVLPSDLPSPINTSRDFQGELIEGWTSAQGRSSTMSSPTYPRDSISSHAQPLSTTSSSPPGPRETILDRAFQLKYIPGSENEVPGEDKLSSLARFDAIMREADQRRRQKEAAARAEQMATRSAFEDDDSSDSNEDRDANSSDTDGDDFTHEKNIESHFEPPLIPPSTQRALQYITGRPDGPRSPTSPTTPDVSKTHRSFHADAVPALPPAPPVRPRTSHGQGRTTKAQRRQSAQILPSQFNTEMMGLAGRLDDDGHVTPTGPSRQSSSSAKRLSFTEFTKRLSSTSSLLLVQTNASGGSSQRSSEIDTPSSSIPRTNLRPPGPGTPRDRDRPHDEQDKRCSWRGGVGVVSTEGGFF